MQAIAQRPLRSVADACALFDALDALDVQQQHDNNDAAARVRVSHVYFARDVDDALHYAPYALRAVPASRRPRNYYIVTRHHIVHACRARGVYAVVCTTQQWMRDTACFAQLRRLRFFGDYLRRKTLRVWLARVRAQQWQRARAALVKQCVHTRAPLDDDVRHVMRALHALSCTATTTRTVSLFCGTDAHSSRPSRAPRRDDDGGAAGAATRLQAMQTAHGRAAYKALARVVHTLRGTVTHRTRTVDEAVRTAPATATALRACKVAHVAQTVHVPCLRRLVQHMLLHAALRLLRTQLTHLVCCVCDDGDVGEGVRYAWRVYVDCHVVHAPAMATREHDALVLQPSCEQLCDDVDGVVMHTVRAIAHVVARVNDVSRASDSSAASATTYDDAAAQVQRVLLHDAVCAAQRVRLLARLCDDYARAQHAMETTCEALLHASALVAHADVLRVRWTTTTTTGGTAAVRTVADDWRALSSHAAQLRHTLQHAHARERVCGMVVLRTHSATAQARGDVEQALASVHALADSVAEAAAESLREAHAEWLSQLALPSLLDDDDGGGAASALTRAEALVAWRDVVRAAAQACTTLRTREADVASLRRALRDVVHANITGAQNDDRAREATLPLSDALAASVAAAQQQCVAHTRDVHDATAARLTAIVRTLDEMATQLTTSEACMRDVEAAVAQTHDMALRQRLTSQLHRLQHEVAALHRCASALDLDVLQLPAPSFDRLEVALRVREGEDE